MQQKDDRVCIHSGCEQRVFVPVNSRIDDKDIHTLRHLGHETTRWELIKQKAGKCVTVSSVDQDITCMRQRVQKCKDTLDLVLLIHIEKLSNRRFVEYFEDEQAIILDKLARDQRNKELTGDDLARFLKIVDSNTLRHDVGINKDQEIVQTLLAKIENSLDQFRESNKVLAKNCYTKGCDSRKSEKCLQAIEYHTRAVQLDPEFLEAYFQRGLTYHSLGDDDHAHSDFDRCLYLQPSHTGSLTKLSLIHSKKGNIDRAVQLLTRAIEVCPQDAKIYLNRAYLYSSQFRYTDVLADINKSLSLSPSRQAYTLRAEINFKLGRTSEGQKDIQLSNKLQE